MRSPCRYHEAWGSVYNVCDGAGVGWEGTALTGEISLWIGYLGIIQSCSQLAVQPSDAQ